MAWRREQRENERLAQQYRGGGLLEASEARDRAMKFGLARALVHDAQDAYAERTAIAQAGENACCGGWRASAPCWPAAAPHCSGTAPYARWQRDRAAEQRLAVEALKAQIAERLAGGASRW